MKEEFERWCLSFAGCSGGDIGNSDRRSIWISGLEWGGGYTPDELQTELEKKISEIPAGYDDTEENLANAFNRQVTKLISPLVDKKVEDYVSTAREIKPFVRDFKGFFRLNLFPVSFKDTNHARWSNEFAKITGFDDKETYLQWCRTHRFPMMKEWVRNYKPKAIICLGKTYVDDFESAFSVSDTELKREQIAERELAWNRSDEGTLLAICPFVIGRYGLNSNARLQAFGQRINDLIEG